MPRRVFLCLVWIVILAAWSAFGEAAEQAKTAKTKKAPAAVSDGKQAKDVKPLQEDDYELQRMLIDTIDQVQRNYVREIPRKKLVEAAIRGILTELDPYSSYIAPEDMDRFRTKVESEFPGGIGITITVEPGQLEVSSPLVGTPAYRAGLGAGDRITEIDGKSTAGITVEEAVRRLKGKEGTSVTLVIAHRGAAKPETVKITREAIHIETVLGVRRKADDSWDYFVDPQRRIAYVRLTAFSRDTAGQLRKVLAELNKKKLGGLILDLRFNPGGLLSSAIEVSSLFVSEGKIVSTGGRNSPERVWYARKEGAFEGFRMAILVNHYSASASEIVAACLQDHKRAVVVGERTWGKGSVQNIIPLEDHWLEGTGREGDALEGHSALKLTTASYHRPSGKNIHRAADAKETDEWGVRPDEGFQVRLDGYENSKLADELGARELVRPKQAVAKPEGPKFVDRQLDKAVDYLSRELVRAN
jgi:carboxyl-terminal processing protease